MSAIGLDVTLQSLAFISRVISRYYTYVDDILMDRRADDECDNYTIQLSIT